MIDDPISERGAAGAPRPNEELQRILERAERLGIVNHVVPPGEIDDFVAGLAHKIAANSPLSIAVIKEELRVLAGAHPLTPRGFERLQGLRRVVYDSHDYEEGIRAFLEKRKPVYRGE